MPFTLSTTPFLFNQQEFGDWLYAQNGSLVFQDEWAWDAAVGPFPITGDVAGSDEATRVWNICVRTGTLRDLSNGQSSFIDIPQGNWWLVGAWVFNYEDASSTSTGYTTCYTVTGIDL